MNEIKKFKNVVLDIETNDLLEGMINFNTQPLSLKEDARLWCVALLDADNPSEHVMFIPEEYIPQLLTKPELNESLKCITEPYKAGIKADDFITMFTYWKTRKEYHDSIDEFNKIDSSIQDSINEYENELRGKSEDLERNKDSLDKKEVKEIEKELKNLEKSIKTLNKEIEKNIKAKGKLKEPECKLNEETQNTVSLFVSSIPRDFDIVQGYKDLEAFVESFKAWKSLQGINVVPLTKEALREALSESEKVIFHNGIKFDAVALQLFDMLEYQVPYLDIGGRYSDFKTQSLVFDREVELVDTLIWSKLLNADRLGGHSLANLGSKGEENKLDFNDFSNISASMIVYCLQDVVVNAQVYHDLMEEKKEFDTIWDKPYVLERKLADLSIKQELFGFHYDKELSDRCKSELDQLLKERYDEVTPQLPPRPLNTGETNDVTPPKIKWSKTSNSLSSHMIRFLEKVGGHWNPISETYTVDGRDFDLEYNGPVKDSTSASIKDLDHIKWYLMSLGWEPTQWSERDLTKDSKKKSLPRDKYEATLDRYIKSTYEGVFKDARLKYLNLSPDITQEEFKELFLQQYIDKPTKPQKVPTAPALKVGTTKDICPNLQKLADEGTVTFVKALVEYYTYQHRRGAIGGISQEQADELGIDPEDYEGGSGFEAYYRSNGTVPTVIDTNATNTSRMAHKVVKIASLLLKQL